MNRTKIEWCDFSWNPITGCCPVSEGCRNCYARLIFKQPFGEAKLHNDRRFMARDLKPFQELRGRRRDIAIRKRTEKGWPEAALELPFIIFVSSVGDMFYGPVQGHWITIIWNEMTHRAPDNIYVILTKRPERMNRFVRHWYDQEGRAEKATPHKNIWMGVSAENQARAEERIPILMDTPAAVRLVSVEPMLGPVDLTQVLDGCTRTARADRRLDWVLAGPETGAGARRCDPEWFEYLESQAGTSVVPFFDKRKLDWTRRDFPLDIINH